jgi:hypothetical protein
MLPSVNRRSLRLSLLGHAASLSAAHPARYDMWSTPRLSLDRGIATSANGAAGQGVDVRGATSEAMHSWPHLYLSCCVRVA